MMHLTTHQKGLVAIVIVAFVLRVQNLGTMSLWLDEIWSVTNALHGVEHIMASQDPARSYPFHLSLFVALQFGNTEFNARLPSLLFGVLAIPLLYWLGKELVDANVGLLSACMLAFWPYHVWYSQEARMYSLFLLVTTASMLVFVKLVKTERKRWLYLLGAVTLLGLYTHFYFVFVVGIQTLCILWWLWQHHFNVLHVTTLDRLLTLLFLLVCIPWVQGVIQMFAVGPALNIPWGLQSHQFWLETFSYLSIGYFGILFAVPLLLLVAYHGWKQSQRTTGFLLLWVFAPTVTLFLLTVLLRPLTGNRYLIFTLPAYLLLLAMGLIQFVQRVKPRLPAAKQVGMAFYLAVMIFGTLAFPTIVLMPTTPREDWRDAVRVLNQQVGDVELVLCYPAYIKPCLAYYGLAANYVEFYPMPSTVHDVSKNMMDAGWEGIWIVLYSWGDSKLQFEQVVTEPLGFALAQSYYQIWIYHWS